MIIRYSEDNHCGKKNSDLNPCGQSMLGLWSKSVRTNRRMTKVLIFGINPNRLIPYAYVFKSEFFYHMDYLSNTL